MVRFNKIDKFFIFFRVDLINAAAENGNGPSVDSQRAFVCDGVDPTLSQAPIPVKNEYGACPIASS